MRISRLLQAATVAAVIGSGAIWAADLPKPSSDMPAVNARYALNQTVSELNVDGVALSRVLEFLRQTSGANIVVNWKVLEGAGISKDTAVTLNVRELTLKKVLRLVLDQASPAMQLAFDTDANVIQITSQDEADKVLITKVYVVDDLVMTDNQVKQPPTMSLDSSTKGGTTTGGTGGGGGSSGGSSTPFLTESSSTALPTETTQKRGDDLAALVRDVVRPTIWKENGGNCTIRYFQGKLIVSAPASVHEAIGGPLVPEGGQRFGM